MFDDKIWKKIQDKISQHKNIRIVICQQYKPVIGFEQQETICLPKEDVSWNTEEKLIVYTRT
jgi:hypothetical protein